MIIHVVTMKFKPDTPPSEIEALAKMLEDLPDKIPEIQMYEFGPNVVESERAYDFALVSLFANPEALSRYQQHPEHIPVVQKLKTICADIVVVDFKGSDASAVRT